MHEVGMKDVLGRISDCIAAAKYDQAAAYLWPALDQYPEDPALWFFGGILQHQAGHLVPALTSFQRCMELEYNPTVLTNIGAVYRRLGDYEGGIEALTRASRDMPSEVDPLVNLGGMYVNEGNPGPGIVALRRAAQLAAEQGKKPTADWNLALLLLESGQFAEGFELYRRGIHAERQMRMYATPAGDNTPHAPEPVTYQPGMPREGKTIIIWGEQGIGDELMFGTIIEEARADFGEVIFECHHRLEWLHRQAHPGMRIFPTRKDGVITWPVTEGIAADYKLPIGDLAALYRPDRDSFKRAWEARAPYYRIDEAERAAVRERLEIAAAGRPIVGLAMRGGTFSTARTHRSLPAFEARRLIDETNAYFVGLDYEDMSGFAEWVGSSRYGNYRAVTLQGGEYHHDGALAAACDLVVTVNQSIAHLSAAMELNTRVLTPKRVAWRYGLEGEEWFLYPHPKAKLIRQDNADSWAAPVSKVIAEINSL